MDNINPLNAISEFLKRLFGENSFFPEVVALKIVVLIFLVFYLFYAFLVTKQVYLMNKFLETKLSPWTKIFAWIYFFYTLFVIIALIII